MSLKRSIRGRVGVARSSEALGVSTQYTVAPLLRGQLDRLLGSLPPLGVHLPRVLLGAGAARRCSTPRSPRCWDRSPPPRPRCRRATTSRRSGARYPRRRRTASRSRAPRARPRAGGAPRPSGSRRRGGPRRPLAIRLTAETSTAVVVEVDGLVADGTVAAVGGEVTVVLPACDDAASGSGSLHAPTAADGDQRRRGRPARRAGAGDRRRSPRHGAGRPWRGKVSP